MDQCAYAQPQQTRQRAAPRQAQQAKGVDDPRWRDLMDQAEAQIAKGEWVKGYNERIKCSRFRDSIRFTRRPGEAGIETQWTDGPDK